MCTSAITLSVGALSCLSKDDQRTKINLMTKINLVNLLYMYDSYEVMFESRLQITMNVTYVCDYI